MDFQSIGEYIQADQLAEKVIQKKMDIQEAIVEYNVLRFKETRVLEDLEKVRQSYKFKELPELSKTEIPLKTELPQLKPESRIDMFIAEFDPNQGPREVKQIYELYKERNLCLTEKVQSLTPDYKLFVSGMGVCLKSARVEIASYLSAVAYYAQDPESYNISLGYFHYHFLAAAMMDGKVIDDDQFDDCFRKAVLQMQTRLDYLKGLEGSNVKH